MKKVNYIITALMLGIATIGKAQQLPATSLYTANLYGINSAYAGYNGCIEGYLSHLSKFISVEGAPKTNFLGVHTSFKENMGAGLRLNMDNTELVDRLNVEFLYSYKLEFAEEHNLRLGLALGFYQVKLDVSNAIVEDIDDEVITGGNQSAITFSDEFSLLYTNKKLQVGLSIPQVLETSTNYSFATSEGSFKLRRHFIAFAGYDYEVNENISIQPSLMYRFIGTSNNQFDINAQATYKRMFSLGLGYRTNTGLLARFGAQVMDMFSLNYVYEFPGANISGYSSGSHEIMLGVKFCKDTPEDEPEDILPEESAPASTEETTPTETETAPVEEEGASGFDDGSGSESTSEGSEGGYGDGSETGGYESSESTVEIGLGGGDAPSARVQEIIANMTPEEKEIIDLRVQFPLNEDIANGTHDARMNRLVNLMNKYEEIGLKIIGHACSRGSAAVNQELSERRAQSIKEGLIYRGISANRIRAIGVSNSEPLNDNSTEEKRKVNRRVEFQVIDNPQ